MKLAQALIERADLQRKLAQPANISENVLSYITNSLSLGNRFLALNSYRQV